MTNTSPNLTITITRSTSKASSIKHIRHDLGEDTYEIILDTPTPPLNNEVSPTNTTDEDTDADRTFKNIASPFPHTHSHLLYDNTPTPSTHSRQNTLYSATPHASTYTLPLLPAQPLLTPTTAKATFHPSSSSSSSSSSSDAHALYRGAAGYTYTPTSLRRMRYESFKDDLGVPFVRRSRVRKWFEERGWVGQGGRGYGGEGGVLGITAVRGPGGNVQGVQGAGAGGVQAGVGGERRRAGMSLKIIGARDGASGGGGGGGVGGAKKWFSGVV